MTAAKYFVAFLLAASTACAAHGALHRKAVELNLAGIAHLKEGDFKAARAAFILALEYNEDFSEAYNNLGVVSLREGDLEAAADFFSQAIELNPDFAEAWNNIGVVAMRTGEAGEARTCFETALQSNPGHVEARLNLAKILLEGGDADGCEMEVLKVLEQQPGRLEARLLLAAVRMEQDDFVRAQDVLEDALEDSPGSAEGWLLLAVLHLGLDREEEAKAALAQADLLAPDETLWVRMGLAHASAGNHERAAVYFRKTLEENPLDPYASAGLVLQAAAVGLEGELAKSCAHYLSLGTDVSKEASLACKTVPPVE